jgi:catechol 2,3-dioxygenase-like lactoylglutathione lyase family enzyme
MGYLDSPLFHVTQVIGTLDAAFDNHRRLFCRPVLYAGYWDAVERDAIATMVGGVVVEGMIPLRRKDGKRSFAAQDLDPFVKAPGGGHLHSLAWYAVGIDDLAAKLRAAGVRFTDTYGELITGEVPGHGPIPVVPGASFKYPAGWKSAVLYTYFEDGPGMIELCEPSSRHWGMGRRQSGETGGPARTDPDPDTPVQGHRDVDPLGIQYVSHQTIAVPDAEAAARFFEDVFDGRRIGGGESETAVARTIVVQVGSGDGTCLELSEPAGPGPVQADLDYFGHAVLHACTFKVADLGAVREQLASEDFGLESDTPSTLVVDPGVCAGARFGFTTSAIAAPGA